MSWNAMRPGRKDDRNKVKRALKAARKMKNKRGAESLWDKESGLDPRVSVVKKVRPVAAAESSGPSLKKRKKNKGAGRAAWLSDMRTLPCHYCRQPGGTADHVIPKSEGGATTPDNCVPACGPCNTFRASRPYGWFKKVGWLERLDREARRNDLRNCME